MKATDRPRITAEKLKIRLDVSSAIKEVAFISCSSAQFHFIEQPTIVFSRFLDIDLICFWRFRWHGAW